MATMTVGTGKGTKRQAVMAACGAALALAVAVGVGAWQATQHSAGVSGGATTAARDTTTAIQQSSGVVTTSRIGATPAAGPLYIYIVGSQEEASFLRQFAAQINALRAERGEQPDNTVVMVIDSADDEGRAAQVIATDYYLSIVGGLPQSRVFDLRTR